MKFAMSYSCGKDSTLALHRLIKEGHEPVCLLVMVNEENGRSFFHGADRAMLECYAKVLSLPLIACPANGATYQAAFEKGLLQARKMGAQAAGFGDIDIEEHRHWDEERCKAIGLHSFFPLWQKKREEVVHELIRLGYKCLIKSINRRVLPMTLLGTFLDDAALSVMSSAGVDLCGENGEYHTLTVDGPVFHKPLAFEIGEKIEWGDYAFADIHLY